MNIRAIKEKDIDEIYRIHRIYYRDEFDLPDFTKHFINAFIIENSSEEIILVGGIRPIMEMVAMTDKGKNDHEKYKALRAMLQIASHCAEFDGFDELHVFVQDLKWKDILLNKGFQETKGKSLVYKV